MFGTIVFFLFVWLFGSGARTIGWIPTKFDMDILLWFLKVTSKYFFWVDPPREKTQKSKLSPYGPGQKAESILGTFCGTIGATLLFFGGGRIYGYSSIGRAERGQSTGWPANGFVGPRSGQNSRLAFAYSQRGRRIPNQSGLLLYPPHCCSGVRTFEAGKPSIGSEQ